MPEVEILDELTFIFRDVFGDDTLKITRNTTADDIEEWDSFNHINLLVAVEMKFGVKFMTAEIEALKSVGDLATLIDAKATKK